MPRTGGGVELTNAAGVQATIRNLTNANPLDVAISDGTGNQITTFGGVSMTDKGGFTEGTSSFTPVGGDFNETLGADPAEDQGAAVRITAKRAFHANLRDAAGVEIASATAQPAGTERGLIVREAQKGQLAMASSAPVVIASDQTVIPVSDNAGSLTVDQATAANLKAQVQGEAASGAAKSGNPVQAGGVFNTTQPTVTTGQVVEAQYSNRGAAIVVAGVEALNVTVNAALPAGANAIGKLAANAGVNIGDVAVTSQVPGTGATNLGKAEDAAHTTGDVGVMALGVRQGVPTDLSAGATNGDYEPFQVDAVGRLWTRTPHQGTGTTLPTYSTHLPAANTQATISRAAGGAGVRFACIGLVIKLVAGTTAPAAFNGQINLIDGASGGVTYLMRATISLPATAGAETGMVISPCWYEGSANTAITLEFNAAGGANTIESVTMATVSIAE